MASSFPELLERINGPLEQVEGTTRNQLASQSPVMRAIGDQVLASGGKRLRPALLLLAAELCGYTGPRRIQVGAAIELLHTATLLHDDVVDQSPLRRGRPSAMTIWGNRRAILAGDFLYARSCVLITEDGDPEILLVFAGFVQQMAEGELLQLQRSFDLSATEADYYAVVERKSAAVISGACECGAILGGVTRAERRRLAEFGRELGFAFQIRDDALDYGSGEAGLGKHHLVDLREGKITLPLLFTLKRCTAAEREVVAGVLKTVSRGGGSSSDPCPEAAEARQELSPALALVRRYSGVEDAIERATCHVVRAREAIAPFPDSPAKDALLAAADFAVSRNS